MELAATMRLQEIRCYSLIQKADYPGSYLTRLIHYAGMEPVTPWLGTDTAKHYQWYPFINLGHYELAK